jgi:hypothetical protein
MPSNWVARTRQTDPLGRMSNFSEGYARLLQAGMALLSVWLKLSGTDVSWTESADYLDSVLLNFIMTAHSSRAKWYIPKHAILAVQFRVPRLRHHLPCCWKALKEWEQRQGGQNRVPIPHEIMLFIFLAMLDRAMGALTAADETQWVVLAVVLRVSFHAILRPMEAMRMAPADIQFIRPPGQLLQAVIAIGAPKTRNVPGAGKTQFAVLKDAGAVLWLQHICLLRDPAAPLWPHSEHVYRQRFTDVAHHCRLHMVGLTLASYRAGGATHAFLNGDSIETIAFAGRWISSTSLRAYIQEAGSRLVWTRVPAAVSAQIQHRLKAYCRIVTEPPPSPLVWPWRLGLKAPMKL